MHSVELVSRGQEDDRVAIRMHYHPLPFDTGYRTYEWVGDRHLPVRMSRNLFEAGEFPWPLEVIREDHWGFTVTVIRTDTAIPFYAYYRLEQDALAVADFFRRVRHRIVLTAMVWGLAKVHYGAEPGWDDLNYPKVFRALFVVVLLVGLVKLL